ncbi:4-hydroxybenzoate octaprenyltransferase [Pelobacter propionicus]|uniref:4-hydroxybenzoate polyprenyltransferase n=1 Tax=Pelobacter propionicus (strain DSM 2379 / NBRC 103807 / OttBd1) TaxID=338966 RepID=A1AKQ4_PELPD|nr:4-hydroxybenzoate octaprenyltransferase [Pelobacter propionicus]ABK97924.1 4-hydroxybenzoate polyprenyltransferase, putative [Pelobacter propionicus DSM 2379]
MNAMTHNGPIGKIAVFLEMIKFSHTVFALPFALSGALLAAGGMPTGRQLFWIVLAMVGARTAAMGLNRLIDAAIDARNPRTAGRAIPAGLIGRGATLLFILASLILMLVAAGQLNRLCLFLSPLAIFFLLLYSYCKRFTSLAHVVLGLCLSAAPLGAWVAIRGSIDPPALILGGAVLFWVAGFDILYALQDLEYDRSAGLHSIPVLLGVEGSLWAARIFHMVMLGLLLALFSLMQMGPWFMAGILITAAMLLYEHWLLRNGDLTRLDAAFFNMNGYISVVFLLGTAAEVLTRQA